MNDTSIQPQSSDIPDRVPLARLAAQSTVLSPALTRVVAAGARSGPGRVTVAAFQSAL